jgi:WD40 repeat protein
MLYVSRNIALKSVMGEKNPELMGLCAVQAYQFNKKNGGNSDDPVIYDALCKGYSTLDGNKHSILAGSPTECKALTEIDNKLVSADFDGNIRIWTTEGSSKITDKLLYDSPINYVSFPGNNWIVTGYENLLICLWELEANGVVKDNYLELKGHKEKVNAANLSMDNNMMVSAGWDSLILIWDIRSKNTSPVSSVKAPSAVRDVLFCGVDSVISAQADGSIVLWDIRNNKSIQLCPPGNELPLSLAWNPTKRTLLAGFSDGMLGMFNFSLEFSGRFNVHTSGIDQIVFNKDFSLFATSSWDRVVKFYNYHSFCEMLEGRIIAAGNLDSRVRKLFFTEDNRLIGSMSDMTIRIWETSSQKLAEKICAVVKRNMTKDEWNVMVGWDIPYETTCADAP